MIGSPIFPQDASIAAKYTEVVWLLSPSFFEAPFLLTYTFALLCNAIHSVVSYDTTVISTEKPNLNHKASTVSSKELAKQEPVAKSRKKSLRAKAKQKPGVQSKS